MPLSKEEKEKLLAVIEEISVKGETPAEKPAETPA